MIFLPLSRSSHYGYSFTVNREDDALAHEKFLALQSDLSDVEPSLTSLTEDKEVEARTWKDMLEPEVLLGYCLTAQQIKYQEIMNELINTEQNYSEDIVLLYRIFGKEILAQSNIPECLRLIFTSLLEIIKLHARLHKELRVRQHKQFPILISIADIFREHVSSFTVYSDYYMNFEEANDIIMNCMSIEEDPLGIFIKNRMNWPECRNLTLQAFLLKPIQRLMKYPLFFKNLCCCFSAEDTLLADHKLFLIEIESIIRSIEKDTKDINEHKKLQELATRIQGLEQYGINLTESGRRLVHEGYLTYLPTAQTPLTIPSWPDDEDKPPIDKPHPNAVMQRKLGSKRKRVYVFLFNDMILCTSTQVRSIVIGQQRTSSNKSCYGIGPHVHFQIVQVPGQITLTDRYVTRRASSMTSPREGPAKSLSRFSLRKNRVNVERSHSQSKKQEVYEEHPRQFVCSIAANSIANMLFETDTAQEKKVWCNQMERVLSQHVQRPAWWDAEPEPTSPSVFEAFAPDQVQENGHTFPETEDTMMWDAETENMTSAVSPPPVVDVAQIVDQHGAALSYGETATHENQITLMEPSSTPPEPYQYSHYTEYNTSALFLQPSVSHTSHHHGHSIGYRSEAVPCMECLRVDPPVKTVAARHVTTLVNHASHQAIRYPS
ncbi:Dbl homology domain-containing protein [Radiomyces spectabilis]|uniref:Dbl homology domain-containing protein n=1 Tax=Radiomyces spectabilis TaxID=64574 RepID=UPI00221EBCDA|nr:Dbl homology domain-containing protein [Radiomyces spectabilis]KAI8393704.1 Dbl homology domain-containing protein [Radiomyces spectabilis]